MTALWAALLALPAAWGLGLGAAMLLAGGRGFGQMPAATIAVALPLLLSAALVPWTTPERRLRLMQALAALGVSLMLVV